MRALIRRLLDHILGCRPHQVARRRDLYGWTGTPQNDKRSEFDVLSTYGEYTRGSDYVEFTGESLKFKEPEQDNHQPEGELTCARPCPQSPSPASCS